MFLYDIRYSCSLMMCDME